MYHILTVGTGYTGLEIAASFAGQKQKVFGMTRSPSRKDEISKRGVEPVIADILKPETLASVPPAHFIVISVTPDVRTPEAYYKTYVEGVRNFLQSCKDRPSPFLILYLSSTGVWGKQVGGKVDERVPPEPQTEREKILYEAEQQVLHCGYPAAVFRLAGIYGPGRNRMADVMQGKWPEKDSNSYLNLIHRDDICGAVRVLFNSAQAGEVYLGVDNEPVPRFEYYSWIARSLGVVPPEWMQGIAATGKQCLNRKLRELGYTFRYPDFRKGYEALPAEQGES